MKNLIEDNLKVDFLLPEWDKESDCPKLQCPICSSKWIIILMKVFICNRCRVGFSRNEMN